MDPARTKQDQGLGLGIVPVAQCRPAMAPEATKEREEERKSEAREESESPTRRRRLADRGEQMN